ncbi:MAG: hypothetical protein AAGB01_01315 [Cyanobacteria bacterium P01_F01_bin.42]
MSLASIGQLDPKTFTKPPDQVMNAVAYPPASSSTQDPESIRKWLAELTDFTPQQIEAILIQMEAPSPSPAS